MGKMLKKKTHTKKKEKPWSKKRAIRKGRKGKEKKYNSEQQQKRRKERKKEKEEAINVGDIGCRRFYVSRQANYR